MNEKQKLDAEGTVKDSLSVDHVPDAGEMVDPLAALTAEQEPDKQDAERYRWVLQHYLEFHGNHTLAAMVLNAHEAGITGGLCGAIDAAKEAK